VRAAYLVLVLGALTSACAHSAPPTVTGAQLYEQVHALQTTGQVTIGAVTVRKSHVLTTGWEGQTFVVEQVIDKCKGDNPTADVDCTLALLLDQRFTVLDHAQEHRGPRAAHSDRSGSMLAAGAVVGLVVAATGGLVYGLATCEFAGCKAVFGVPLVAVGGLALFSLGRD
jgi:hypothetical protein